jgi:hypothetical protein
VSVECIGFSIFSWKTFQLAPINESVKKIAIWTACPCKLYQITINFTKEVLLTVLILNWTINILWGKDIRVNNLKLLSFLINMKLTAREIKKFGRCPPQRYMLLFEHNRALSEHRNPRALPWEHLCTLLQTGTCTSQTLPSLGVEPTEMASTNTRNQRGPSYFVFGDFKLMIKSKPDCHQNSWP